MKKYNFKPTTLPGMIAVALAIIAEYPSPFPYAENIQPLAGLLAAIAAALFAYNVSGAHPTPPIVSTPDLAEEDPANKLLLAIPKAIPEVSAKPKVRA